jgi:membrane fusion protein (multidrug efflux system)
MRHRCALKPPHLVKPLTGQASFTLEKSMKTLTTAIAALFLLTGCDNAQISAPEGALPQVGIVTLMSQPVPVVSELTGRTSAALSAEVRPQVGGIIQKRLFNEGDTVKAGQALYQIDPASFRASYDEAAAALKQAQSLVQADCQKARRYAQLVKDDGVSRQDAEDAQATCAQDKASVESKKAALESARISLNWTTVTAPISGRIGISSVTPGALVTAQQETALATIRGLDSMYVDLTRSSADLLRLRKQTLSTNSDTLSVSLILEDGSTYSANVDEGIMDDAILAPQQGITRDAKGNATALVVNGSNKVEQRTLQTGETYGDKWLVLSGLKAGDKLIVEGTGKVASGQEVKAEEIKTAGGDA